MLARCQDAVIATADRDSPQCKLSEYKKRLLSVDFFVCLIIEHTWKLKIIYQ